MLVCFLVISRNMLVLCHFRALWGAGYDCVWPPWIFEGHGSPVPTSVKTYMCILYTYKIWRRYLQDYFQKVHANSPLHRQIIVQIQTKRSGVGVEAVWSAPTPTPTPHHWCWYYKCACLKIHHRREPKRGKSMSFGQWQMYRFNIDIGTLKVCSSTCMYNCIYLFWPYSCTKIRATKSVAPPRSFDWGDGL